MDKGPIKTKAESQQKVWTDDICRKFGSLEHFPFEVLDLAVQKNVISRFFDFYLGMKARKCRNVPNLVFPVIAIAPLHVRTEVTAWKEDEYDNGVTLFSLPKEDLLLAERNATADTRFTLSSSSDEDEATDTDDVDELESSQDCSALDDHNVVVINGYSKNGESGKSLETETSLTSVGVNKDYQQNGKEFKSIEHKKLGCDNYPNTIEHFVNEIKERKKNLNGYINSGKQLTSKISDKKQICVMKESDENVNKIFEKRFMNDHFGLNGELNTHNIKTILYLEKECEDNLYNKEKHFVNHNLELKEDLNINLGKYLVPSGSQLKQVLGVNEKSPDNLNKSFEKTFINENLGLKKIINGHTCSEENIFNDSKFKEALGGANTKSKNSNDEKENSRQLRANSSSTILCSSNVSFEKHSEHCDNLNFEEKLSSYTKPILQNHEDLEKSKQQAENLSDLNDDCKGIDKLKPDDKPFEIPFHIRMKWFGLKKAAEVERENDRPIYNAVHNAAFIPYCNSLLRKWDTDVKARIVLKCFFGLVALTLMRGVTKGYRHLVNTFSSNKFLNHIKYINKFTGYDFPYSTPHKECIGVCFNTFKKRDEKTRIMFAKIVTQSSEIDLQLPENYNIDLDKPFSINIFKTTMLVHSANYRLELVTMVQFIDNRMRADSLNKVIKATYCKETALSWRRLKNYMDNYLTPVAGSSRTTHHWARVIDDKYFEDLCCTNNYALAVILAVINERISGNNGIWRARWIEMGDKERFEEYKELGHDMLNKLLSDYPYLMDD